jgi:hypothetical protein
LLGGEGRRRRGEEEVRVAQDGLQRRAQLVAHHVDEEALGTGGRLRRRQRALHLELQPGAAGDVLEEDGEAILGGVDADVVPELIGNMLELDRLGLARLHRPREDG